MITVICRFCILFQWFTSLLRKCLDCLDFFLYLGTNTHICENLFSSKDYCLLILFLDLQFFVNATRDAMCRFSELLLLLLRLLLDFACIEFIYFLAFFFGLISLALVDFDMHILHLNFIWDKTVTIFYLHTIDSVWVLLFYNWIELYLPYRANRCDERNTLLDEISTQMIFQHEYL